MILNPRTYTVILIALAVGCQNANSKSIPAQAVAPIYQEYTADDHGGGELSSKVAHNSLGELFCANESGLLKFDGETWNLMPTTGHASYINSVAIDQTQQIWITGQKSIGYYSQIEGGEYQFNDLTHSVLQLPQEEKLGTFWALYTDKEKVYLITSNSVLMREDSKWTVSPFTSKARILPSWIDGRLYIHSRGEGLFKLSDNQFELVIKDEPDIASGIISVLSATDEGLLCATVSNGLFYVKEGNTEQLPIHIETPQIVVAKKLRNGNIAIGTGTDGVIIIDQIGQSIGHIRHSNSVVYDIEEDRYGAIWVATTGAILHISNLAISNQQNRAYDIQSFNNKIYYTNGSQLKTAALKPEEEAPPEINASSLWSIYSTNTELLLGSYKNLGVLSTSNSYSQIPFERHITRLCPSNNDSNVMYTSDPPAISKWIKSNSKWEVVGSLNDFYSSTLSIIDLPNGQLLTSSENNSILQIDWSNTTDTENKSPSILKLGTKQGLPDKFVWAYCLRLNECVVVISDKGLFRYDGESEMFHYDPIFGSDLGRDAYGLESCPSANNDGWFLRLPTLDPSENQIGHLSITDDKQLEWILYQLPSVHFAGKVESLLHEQVDGAEILWVGGSKDLLRYDLTNMPNHPAPGTRLTAIREQDTKQTYFNGAGQAPQHLEWQFPQKTLRLEYAAPPTPIKVTGYQTRLAGFNQDWSEPSKTTFSDFTNLSNGDYTFEVQAIDEFGRAGKPASLNFTILPPWYRTAYAYIGYAIAVLSSLYIASRWRIRKLRLKNEELDALVNKRTCELEQQKLKLIKANRAKQNFLASMSHEIRNPLNGIVGITRILHKKEKERGQQTDQINHLHACSKHLHQLLGQTLDYSSLEAGKLRTRIESFDPSTQMNEVIQIQEEMAQAKGIQLTLEQPNITFRWKGDSLFLSQILINLISNGIKYTPSGSVNLALTYQEKEDSVEACFEVTDTGPGIPKNKQGFIFEEFTRLPESEASHIPGTGLGLAISSEMAQLMGGRLELDGDYQGGARFLLYVEFGIDLFAPTKKQVNQQEELKALAGKRILIADDMDFNRYISAEVLRSMGAHIDEAENGLVALEKLRSTTYDIAILDINMPKMSGPETVEAFLKDNTEPTPDFIALSAYTTPEMETSCIAAGFNHFIEKPLEPEKLKKLLIPHHARTKKHLSHSNNSFLSYLASSRNKTLDELQQEYQESFEQELDNLRITLINDDYKEQRNVIHKLLGLYSIHKTPKMDKLMEALSSQSKQQASKEEIAATMEQLSAQLNQELSKQ